MEDYQQRVVDEKSELDRKLDALSAFLRGEIIGFPDEEIARLERQQAIMANYSAVLDERISAF